MKLLLGFVVGVLATILMLRAVPISPLPTSQTAGEPVSSSHKQLYQCSMHPQIVSEKPGLCPICQMRLEPVVNEGSATKGGARGKPLFYRHPMRPDVSSPVPAKDEMGMDYIPVYADEVERGSLAVAGRAPFTLSTERQQLIGVRTDVVDRRDLDFEIRAVGKVAYDPALYQAIVEYQEAMAGRKRVSDSNYPDAQLGAQAIVRAAALRLRQLGLAEQQLREMAESGRPPVSLLLPSDSAWVYAEVYEHEIGLVQPGQRVVVTARSLPGQTFEATVGGIDPIVTAATRTARVRIRVATPHKSLRPEAFVDVRILVPSSHELAIPEEAVLDSGDHQIVFVVVGEGRFEPRSVQLGRLAQGYYAVTSGLAAQERVVTSANFLIDSESRFRAAVAAFAQRTDPAESRR